MSLDGLSLSCLVAELNLKLAGGRIDKIFQIDKYTLILLLRLTTENVKLIISVNPEHPRIHITTTTPENPVTPPAFCMLLRKHFEDGRISQICQHSLDRIFSLNVDIRGPQGSIVTKSLVVELMGKHSNIIFVQDNIVVDAIKRIGINISRFRQILPGKEYTYPPGQLRSNLFTTPLTDFVDLLHNHTGSLTKAIINTGMGIGPVTAKEIIWRAGLPTTIMVDALEPMDTAAVSEAIHTIIQPLKEGDIEPTIVLDTSHRITGIAAFRLEHLDQDTAQKFPTMSSAVEFTTSLKPIQNIPEKDILKKILSTELARQTRKQTTLTQELAEANSADVLRRYADILMTHLYMVPTHAPHIILPDIYNEQPDAPPITIDLNPLLSPMENTQAYYAKYNKLKRAQDLLVQQLTQCAQDIDYLDSISVSLDHATAFADIADIRQELITAGYLKALGKKRPSIAPSVPLQALTQDGFTILIGKNNKQNDLVTFKHAQPDDLWFHTKDIPGSHVILRVNAQQIPESAITTAAHLAAYFSKARQSSNVPVDYTKRRYVKKPSGAKPGFVIYERQTTLFITPDETLIKSLLKV